MHAFTRIAAFVFALLFQSFLAGALPTAPRTLGSDLGGRLSKDKRHSVGTSHVANEVRINALVGRGTKAELSVAIDALVALFKVCADDLIKVGAGLSIIVEAKASIVASICSIITVSVKFGVFVLLNLSVKIDLCLKLLLVNINICVSGILILIAKALFHLYFRSGVIPDLGLFSLASATVGVLRQIHPSACLSVLGLGGINLGLGL